MCCHAHPVLGFIFLSRSGQRSSALTGVGTPSRASCELCDGSLYPLIQFRSTNHPLDNRCVDSLGQLFLGTTDRAGIVLEFNLYHLYSARKTVTGVTKRPRSIYLLAMAFLRFFPGR